MKIEKKIIENNEIEEELKKFDNELVEFDKTLEKEKSEYLKLIRDEIKLTKPIKEFKYETEHVDNEEDKVIKVSLLERLLLFFSKK